MREPRYYVLVKVGAYTLDEVKDLARKYESPIKFFDENGFLKGTAYPNGEVQT